MKNKLTEIVVVLDESGSMEVCKHDTIGGFNEFIKTQRKIKGKANVTLVKFSDYYKIVNDGVDINHITLLNDKNYTPSFTTALLDAVGNTINNVGNRLAKTPESERPEKVIMTIITDGYENASVEFTRKQIFEMVKHQKEKYAWEFLYIGANQDSWAESSSIGVDKAVNYDTSNSIGMFDSTAQYITNYRVDNKLDLSVFDSKIKEEDNK